MTAEPAKAPNPWSWIPTLYFAEGIPYVVVMTVAVVLYKRMGISNTDIALYTSWLYLPWVIKPLWSPFVDLCRTKRFWIVATQLLIGAGLAGIALTIPIPSFFQWTLAIFWLLAFSSATHDIAADGFYMLAMSADRQAFFVGIRSTFYRFAMITGQGLLLMLAGLLESGTGLPTVTVEVAADPAIESTLPSLPEAPAPGVTESGGEPEIRVADSTITLGTARVDPEQSKNLIAGVKRWNVNRGHTRDEAEKAAEAGEPSWFTRSISTPLGDWLRRNFGEKREAADPGAGTGGLALVRIGLTAPPPAGETVAVTFGRTRGDKSFALVQGERLVFTESNWRGPALALVQLDHRLRTASTAVFEARSGNVPLAWSITFFVLAGAFLFFTVYHRFALPRPTADKPTGGGERGVLAEFWRIFVLFFKRREIVMILAFLLIYRLAEAQLVKLAAPFLLDARQAGGLGLTTGEVGFVYGTVGIIALTLGGILGGIAASRKGLKFWLLTMVVAINVPDAVYIYLSWAQPESFVLVNLCVAVEQFGYGFGFTAYMLYMIYASRGEHQTAHFAITTGFMALGMMIPGMWSGWLQECIGYNRFFIWVLIATAPCFLVAALVKIDPAFGRKSEEK